MFGRLRRLSCHVLAFVRLPPRVIVVYLRFIALALRRGDRWSLAVATRPSELRTIVGLARGRHTIVEVGTGTGWTTSAIAVAHPRSSIVTFDPFPRDGRERYIAALPPSARQRVRMVDGPGEVPPTDAPADVDLLFIDGEHDAASTTAAYEAWRDRLADGAVVVFHDYGDPAYPGVQAAVERLALPGESRGRVFVATPPVRRGS
jgi:predicted O-methyltransferase YrrM